MATKPFIAEKGFMTQVLGSVAVLAVAAPLTDGGRDEAALTHATRMGFYWDRTTAAEKIGAVVMGTERVAVTTQGLEVSGVLQLTNTVAANNIFVIKAAAAQSGNMTEWRDSANNLLSAISSLGYLRGVSGSAGAPAFSFNGDTDTGMYSPSGNQLSFATDGGERLRVYSNGGVDIGGTYAASPGAASLRCAGSVQCVRASITAPGGGSAALSVQNVAGHNGPLVGVYTSGGSSLFQVTTGGLVAIGVDLTPTEANLHIMPAVATTIGAIIQGAAAQTANLQEWRDNAGTVMSRMTASGALQLVNTATNGVLLNVTGRTTLSLNRAYDSSVSLLDMTLIPQPTTTASRYHYGINLSANCGNAFTSQDNIFGAAIQGGVFSSTSGTLAVDITGIQTTGQFFYTGSSGTASASTVTGLYARANVLSSTGATASVTTVYGIRGRIDIGNTSGADGPRTIGTVYGLHLSVEDTGGPTVTDRFGVYQADPLSRNYFAGAVICNTFFRNTPQSVTANATITSGRVKFTGSTSAQTLTLPAGVAGTDVFIRNAASVAVTVACTGSDTIEGGTSFVLDPAEAICLCFVTSDWTIF